MGGKASHCPGENEPFQFSLRHLFLLTTAASLYLALERSAGPLLAALALGVFVLATVIILARIDNMLAGGLAGAILACVILVFLGLMVRPNWDIVMAWLLYPALGYFIGTVCAAERSIRSG